MDVFLILDEVGHNDRSKSLVFGYLREAQNCLFHHDQTDNTSSPTYYTVAELVYNLCLCFYYTRSYFVRCSEWASLLEDGNVASSPYLEGTAHGFMIDLSLSQYVYCWHIALDTNGVCAVSLRGSESKALEGDMEPFTSVQPADANYGTYASNAVRWSRDTESTPYGEPFGAGDILGMEVNAQNRTLSFYKNRVCQGVAFRNLPRDLYYRLAVTFHGTVKIKEYSVSRISARYAN